MIFSTKSIFSFYEKQRQKEVRSGTRWITFYYQQMVDELENGLLEDADIRVVDVAAEPDSGVKMVLEATGVRSVRFLSFNLCGEGGMKPLSV